MRKLIALLLVAVMLLGMMPYGSAAEDDSAVENPAVSEEAPAVEEPAAEEPAAEEPAAEETAEENVDQNTIETDIASGEAEAVGASDDAQEEAAAVTVDISGTVYWVNSAQQNQSERPQSVTITLLANGAAVATTTVKGPSGTSSDEAVAFSFTGLAALDESGKTITYTVVQSALNTSHYETTYSGDTLTITNSYIGASTNHTFGHIDVRIEGAKLEFTYVVKDGNGVVISRTPKTVECSVTNVDYVILNGTTYTGFTQSGTYEFRKLNLEIKVTDTSTAIIVVDLVDTDGNAYDNVSITYGKGGIMDAAYECDGFKEHGKFDGLDFIVGKAQNYIIEITSYGLEIGVQKNVTEAGVTSAFSGSGGEFSFKLVENETGRTWTVTNDANGVAKYMITYPYSTEAELQAYDGKTYTYTLTEIAGSDPSYIYDNTDYTFSVKLTVTKEGSNLVLTPTLVEGSQSYTFNNVQSTTEVSGKKTWEDNDNQDGIRPASITVRLLADGKEVNSKTVTAADDWAWSFTDLPKYENGVEIVYTVEEAAVEGYTATYDGYNITNTHTPEIITISGAKTWDDANNQDGVRPASITIRLYADGMEIASKTVTEADGWKWNFAGLPKNKAGKEIVYTVTEDAVDGYTSTVSGYNVTNSYTPETVSVSGTKTWDDANNQDGMRPESITINLLANGKQVASKTVTAADGWAWSFTNLDKYAGGVEIVYTITEEAVDGYTSVMDGYNVTNTHAPETVSIPVTKVWDDSGDQDGIRPDSVTVNLLADGVVVETVKLGKTNFLERLLGAEEWAYTFENLPKYADGKEIVYTVEEVAVDGYTTIITYNAENGFTITNTHTPETITISGAKTWNDNNDQDGVRPDSITVNLLADGEVVATTTATAETGWTYTFQDMPKFADGKEIKYTVQEVAVDGYTAEVKNFDITNTHEAEKISISGTKHWDDNNDQDGIRPDSITVNLLANGEVVASQEVKPDLFGNWKYTFENLDKYANGVEIVYTVQEVAVEGYESAVDGNDIYNTHTTEVTSISGSKTWQDNNNQDGIRPESITINLLANGEKVASKVVTAADEWKWSFTDLPMYEAGKKITYTITENAVTGYTATVVGYNVVNVHIPETVTVSGNKTWVDGDDQDGIRPDSITVNLYADGVKVDSVEVKPGLFGIWSYSFRGLPKYSNGVEIHYTVSEEAVEGYIGKVNGYDITNTHDPEETQLTVKKVWDDKNDENKKRPDSIKVTLYANGKSTGKTLTLSAGNKWAGTFQDLPKYDDGKLIKYTVKEASVSNYKASYAYSGTNVTITNTFSVIPVTGDFSELYGHMMIMGLSAAALVVLGILGRRRYLF